jgi:hypothetical protein
MNEAKIEQQLYVQQEFIDLAKRSADLGNLEWAARSLAKAKQCKDAVYGLLMEAKPDERGLSRITKEMILNRDKTKNHPFAVQCRKQFDEGVHYCERRLQEVTSN